MRTLTNWFTNFCAGGPYRFLSVLIAGALITGFGIVHDVYIEPTHNTIWQWILIGGIFAVYFLAACWYGYLIYRGKWATVWDYVRRSQEILRAKRGDSDDR
jgi:hypothetical protein